MIYRSLQLFALALVASVNANASAATDGTVRMDLFDDVSGENGAGGDDLYSIDGQPISGSTGFFLFDISNNAILDAELNILTGGSTVARTFDETDFGFETTASGILFGLSNATPADLTFDNTPQGSGELSASAGSIDFANESGVYSMRTIANAGFSPSFHFNEQNPGLIFTPAAVPEPSTLMLMGSLLITLSRTRRVS